MLILFSMVDATVATAPAFAAGDQTYRAALADLDCWSDYRQLVKPLQQVLETAECDVTVIDADALCDPDRFSVERFDLLVLANAGVLPKSSMEPITKYLQAGGDLIAFNTLMWQETTMRRDGKWVTPEDYLADQVGELPPHVLFDFAPNDLDTWHRVTNHTDWKATYESVDGGPGEGQRALHVTVPRLDGWDTFGTQKLDSPFPADHTLTVFSARGSQNTTQLSIEWEERDGSRWFAVVPLSHEWRRYVLAPKDFKYWPSNPDRGKEDDAFNPQAGSRFRIGLAYSHTGHMPGPHEYRVGPIGTSHLTPEYEQILDTFDPPPMDTLWPAYKFYDVVTSEEEAGHMQCLAGAKRMPRKARAMHPRAQGGGFDKGRDWRWTGHMSLTEEGEWRGYCATRLVHAEGPFKGGVWFSFAADDPLWYRGLCLPASHGTMLADFLKKLSLGVFVLDGGSDHFTYLPDQPVTFGVRAVNLSRRHKEVTARIRWLDAGQQEVAMQKEIPLECPRGEIVTASVQWRPESWPADGFKASVWLLHEAYGEGELPADLALDTCHLWRPGKETRFVTIENGDFMLNGKRWRPHGVNYMPSSGIATEDWDYFEHWLGDRSYDPIVVERDLKRIKDIGFNAVSVFIHHDVMKDQNLLDLLRQCEELDLKVNLSLRPGTPMDFRWDKMREMVEYYRLAENDTVFAYDLAWEPMFRKGESPTRWDREWEAWVHERYRSIEAAEREWEFKAPRDEKGRFSGPTREQIESSGEWNSMVAAYRRFLDTLLYRKYGEARRLMRSIDPNHLVSFRMSNAGDPTFNWKGYIPYDWAYLAGAVDILEPEAYGRIGDWEKVKPGWFTYEYARWANPGLPVMWAEMGVSAWDRSLMRTTPELLEFQADYYRDFYRMLIASGADGIFFWWYPGGFRCYERSDYGIVNPDGTDRPVTKVIRDMGPKFINGPDSDPVDTWIEIDRDRHANGLTGIYAEVKDEFWSAIGAGRTPGLRTAGTGTDSSNCPPLAVGNVSWTGMNPPKYLDGLFERVEVLKHDDEWVEVEKRATVKVLKDAPVLARVTLSNPGEATWLAPGNLGGEPGGVYVIVEGQPALQTPILTDIVRFDSVDLGSVELTTGPIKDSRRVTLTFLAEDRAPFGERFTMRLVASEQ